jgi:Arc/MetJ-type ribon-helix-helix transcriptional regulator
MGWCQDGAVAEADRSEKITINVGLVDLGQIDLLVEEGLFTNRTDFIRTAIRRQLESRSEAVADTVARRTPPTHGVHSRRGRSATTVPCRVDDV